MLGARQGQLFLAEWYTEGKSTLLPLLQASIGCDRRRETARDSIALDCHACHPAGKNREHDRGL